MNDYELAITRCKQLESLLEKEFGASGRGLHEKVSSVEGKLPEPLRKKLRFIATVRNKLMHDASYAKLDDPESYIRACDTARADLYKLIAPPIVVNKGKGCFGLVALAASTAMAAATGVLAWLG